MSVKMTKEYVEVDLTRKEGLPFQGLYQGKKSGEPTSRKSIKKKMEEP